MIEDVKTALAILHSGIAGIVSVPGLVRKIESAMLPAVCIRTGECDWGIDTSGAILQRRIFYADCLVEPLTQNLVRANEELVDILIERFGAAYCQGHELIPGAWIDLTTVGDGGIQTVDLGSMYVGFVFSFVVNIRYQ